MRELFEREVVPLLCFVGMVAVIAMVLKMVVGANFEAASWLLVGTCTYSFPAQATICSSSLSLLFYQFFPSLSLPCFENSSNLRCPHGDRTRS